jgi:ketosteroid isomerase-like protein
MKSRLAIGLCLILLTAVAVLPLIAATTAKNNEQAATTLQSDEQAVQQAAEKFYTALNNMFKGDLKLMNEVWSHNDDVTYMGPAGGIQRGWNDVFATWEAQAAKNLGGKVEAKNINITFGPDLATFTCYEEGENFVNGKPQKVSIRATNTFRKENGEWKMIGHHTDLLPFLN